MNHSRHRKNWASFFHVIAVNKGKYSHWTPVPTWSFSRSRNSCEKVYKTHWVAQRIYLHSI